MMALVDAYLDLRRAVGFKLCATASRLRSYARVAQDRAESHIRTKTATAWAATASSPRERHNRIRDLAIFARHLRAEDPTHDLPDKDAFPFQHRVRLPHIFSDEEIARILDAAGRLGPPATSRADTYRTLFALLVTTGLRIGEALRLKLEDLTVDGLLIHNTKFRKSRLVPLHPTTITALAEYRARWRVVVEPDAPFFVSTRGPALAYSTVHDVFHTIERGLNRPADGPAEHGRRSPCLHSFRHTFAVRALEACPDGRAAINRHTLALSTYLGHSSVASTYWYLHATPRLMSDIADACEAWRIGGER